MSGSRSTWKRLRVRLLGGLVAPGLLAVAGDLLANPETLPPPIVAQAASATAAIPPLDLAACRSLALQKQPAVSAAQASLAAALVRQQALENLHVPTFLQPDLPKRRQQSALGVSAAQAGVLQAEIDTLYGAQFAFISYVYAADQALLVKDALRELAKLADRFKNAADDQEKQAQGKVEALILLAEGRQQEALVGMERSLSLLREAVGLDGDCPLVIVPQPLADGCKVELSQVVELALARRPEIVQAGIGTEVTDLEISAQKSHRFALSVSTFANGSDLHVNPLPGPSFNPSYRPGAIGLEMPPTMNGKRCDRVEQATILNGRAHSVLEKTRNLIRLETEQAFLRWKEASSKLVKFERGLERARESLKLTNPPDSRRLTDFIDTARLGTDLRFEVNKAHYELRTALLALERATAGGFCAGLDKPAIVGTPGKK